MRFRVGLAALGLVIANIACAGGSLGNSTPIMDMDQAVLRASRGNPFPATSTVIFRWRVNAPDLRLEGNGVARLQNPDLARLDLFMENGEAVLAAGLVEDQLWAHEEKALEFVPTPALLWAFLGVFRPGEDATRLGGEDFENDVSRVRYGLPDGDELWYVLRSGRLSEVELRHEGHAVHDVTLKLEDGRELPAEATYHNVAAFSVLRVTVDTVERVDSHPSDIWYPVP